MKELQGKNLQSKKARPINVSTKQDLAAREIELRCEFVLSSFQTQHRIFIDGRDTKIVIVGEIFQDMRLMWGNLYAKDEIESMLAIELGQLTGKELNPLERVSLRIQLDK